MHAGYMIECGLLATGGLNCVLGGFLGFFSRFKRIWNSQKSDAPPGGTCMLPSDGWWPTT